MDKNRIWIKTEFLILPQSLTNVEIQKYYQNQPDFKGVYSQNSLLKNMKDRLYVINLDEYKSIGTHWIVLYVHGNSVTYFNVFGAKHTPKEIKQFQ